MKNFTLNNKTLLLAISFLCLLNISYGQVQIYSLDFETAGGYTTTSVEGTDNAYNYFIRTDGTNIGANVVLANIQGASYFAAQDIDDVPGVTSPATLNIDDINVAGYTNLEIRVFLAEDDDGVNQDWDAGDFVHFNYDIDNTGTFSYLLWVEGLGGFNTAPYIDTDYDGTGDGTEITEIFTQHTQAIAGTGALIDIEIVFALNAGDEDIAIDNIEIWGTALPTDTADWCNLQSPPTSNIYYGDSEVIYAQIYELGVTEAAGQGVGIEAWIGYSSTDADPAGVGWTWLPATYFGDVGNNDEYSLDLGAVIPSDGTFYYASRFRLNSSILFTYGGYNAGGGGFWDGVSNVNGVMTVSPHVVNWCNLQDPPNGAINLGDPFTVFGQVYQSGVTDSFGQGAGITAWIGYNTADTDPSTWTNWVPTVYNPACLTCGVNNDEYMADLGASIPGSGTYYYATRFQLNTGPGYTYGGLNAGGGGFWDGTVNVNGVLNVAAPSYDVMITQYYEGTSTNKWIEIRNVSGAIVPANSIYIVVLNNADADNPASADPSLPASPSFNNNLLIATDLAVDEIRRYREPSAVLPAYSSPGELGYDGNPTYDLFASSFSGDDIVMISTSNDSSTWANRIDVIGDGTIWGDRRCFVRNSCVASGPSITWDINDWVEFTDAEVESPVLGTNPYLGLHEFGATTFDATFSWTNGTPDLSRQVIIDEDYDTTTYGSFSACSLNVNAGFTLNIDNNTFAEVENNVSGDGNITVQTAGSFVQNNPIGTFNLNGTALVNKVTALKQAWYYYTYWSSPVVNETVAGAFPDTPGDRRFWFNAVNYLDADLDDIDDDDNDWQIATAGSTLTPGVGYAATSSTLIPPGPFTDTADFVGNFNTGDISTAISYNVINLNSWNFIGNPYPCALDFDAFYAANSTVIDGAAYFWSQSLPPDDVNPGNEGQNFNMNDYATYTVGSGGVAGASGVIPSRYVPSAQGFFVVGLNSNNVTFNNSMRTTGNNDVFYRIVNNTDENKNKLWVNLTSDNGVFSQILIAYVDGATNDFDGMSYDAPRNLASGNAAMIYSIIEGETKKFAIQGKHLESLNSNEIIPLGIKNTIEVETEFKLSVAHLEGEFMNENTVYLKDNLLDVYHNLSASDYTFTSEVGEFNERFELRFASTLSIDDLNYDANALIIENNKNNGIDISTSLQSEITNIKIYDLLGRKLQNLNINNKTLVTLNTNTMSTSVYITKVTLLNGHILTKKILL